MPDMKSSWDPKRYPFRKPTDLKLQVGRVVNPPRTLKAGGVGEASFLPLSNAQKGTNLVPNSVGPVNDRGKGSSK